MADNLLRIAITAPEVLPDEPQRIVEILSHGWDYVHLRHPDASWRHMRDLIEAIPQRWHSRLKLHGHFELLNDFNLGGIHLNSRCPVAPHLYHGPVSRTCHSLQEVFEAAPDTEYVTLSPIFDSISKAGYRAAFSQEQLMSLSHTRHVPVVALGGVNPENAPTLADYGFAGYAALGYLMLAPIDQLGERLDSFC